MIYSVLLCLTGPNQKSFLGKMVSFHLFFFFFSFFKTCDLCVVTNCLLLVDETIGYVLTTLRDQSVPYTAVYTGLRPSHVRQTQLRDRSHA